MAEKGKTKLKLLFIKQYLEAHSDENHPVDAQELMQMLEENDIFCERKSIYSDVQALRDFDMEIFRVKSPKNGYYLGSRTFETPELRLLIDAVQAASFITPKKSHELIGKICTLCSEGQAAELRQHVSIEPHVKCTNEEIYYNIDIINQAIAQEKKISFCYIKRELDQKNRSVKLKEKQFTVSPYALIWSNDHYYLVSNNAKYNNLMHTRIDRMKHVALVNRKARPFSEVSDYRDRFDTADYAAKSFNMFSGKAEPIVLVCSSEILEEILDRFGTDVSITDTLRGSRFRLETESFVSDGLVSWLMQFADKIEVLAPASLRAQVKARAEQIAALYPEDTFFEEA